VGLIFTRTASDVGLVSIALIPPVPTVDNRGNLLMVLPVVPPRRDMQTLGSYKDNHNNETRVPIVNGRHTRMATNGEGIGSFG
jgi:hypothetical protein